MKKLTFNQIKKLQKEYGFDSIQKRIDDGSIWKFEGSMGREAMRLLEMGVCMLPKESTSDYYGNTIPSRDVLKNGTKGTFGNAQRFWEDVLNGEFYLEPVEADSFYL